MKYEKVVEEVMNAYRDVVLKRQDILENGDMDSDEYIEAYQILCDKDKVAELLLPNTYARLGKHALKGGIITSQNEYDAMMSIIKLVKHMEDY